MENSYGVGVVNRYALFLDDESDPLDAIKASEQAKELKKKTKDAEKENKGKPEVKPKGPTAPVRKGIKETQNVKSQDIKSGEQQKAKGPPRPIDRNNAERPPPRRPREDRPQNGAVDSKDGAPRPPRRDFAERGERRPNYERRNFDNSEGGERRGPRPPREPRGDRDPRDARDGPRGPRPPYDNRGKREFDRRSGSDKTGVKPVDKREGGGPHNWGTIKDDIDELNKTGSEGEPVEEKPVVEGAAGAAGAGDAAAPEPAVPAEDEPRELTLDEYKALRNAQRTQPQYNLRKAGEGEDLTQWKKLVPLEKKKEATGSEGEDTDEEYDLADYPQRVGRQKRVLGIEFTFNDMSRRGAPGGRGRGGRGGRGGRPGRGAPGPRDEPAPEPERPAPRQTAPPKVDDSKDFPSLG